MSMWNYYQYMKQAIDNRCPGCWLEYGELACDHFLTVMTAEEFCYGWYPSEDDIYLWMVEEGYYE